MLSNAYSKTVAASFVMFIVGLFSVDAYAAPTVNGLTISWPDDGYYQVQRSSDFSSICEGTSECTVSAGEYIVINHTTGQRFEQILVTGSVDTDPTDFQIDGNRFIFPEGDWFQVQTADTFESVCNGDLECTVDSGRYVVINHSTQQRFDNIVIGTPEQPDNDGTPPTVSGNVISWADDGWYQVQDSFNFTTICEGGTQCEVEPGDYRVINLTTNTRFENIIVSGAPPVEPPVEPPVTEPSLNSSYPSEITVADASLLADSDVALPEGAEHAGDINGDGLDDIFVILEGEASFDRTAAILFADGVGSYPDLPLDSSLVSDANAVLTHGFLINDVSPGFNGVGDVNNDGFDDLSLQSSGFFALAERVVLAGAASFPARLSTDNLPTDQLLVQLPISGSLIRAGDINGDGVDDIFVSGPSDVTGGVIYGEAGLNRVIADRESLRNLSLFSGCAGFHCSTRPIGDFDGDGFDDLFVSRLGGDDCGFASFTLIVYGQSEGIQKLANFTQYTSEQATRIVGDVAGDCFPRAVGFVSALGDVDGDGATDLVLKTNLEQTLSHLIFGMSDRRRGFVSINELDGQRGVTVVDSEDVSLTDINNDGFDDILFSDGTAYAGFARNIDSIDGPVVRRTPTEFVINIPNNAVALDRAAISVNGIDRGEFDAAQADITIDDLTGGVEARVEVQLFSSENPSNSSTSVRVVPAFENKENVTVELLAPRQVEITFNGDFLMRRLGKYLVWRDGVPIGRSINGADNYIDESIELGQTYSYYVTPDYLPDESLDASTMQVRPLLQRQSNSVSISTPEL